MRVTIIPIVIGAFGTVTKRLLKGPEDLEIRSQVETIQTTTFLRTARTLRFEGTCSHSNSSERPSAKADVENSQGVNNNKSYIIKQKSILEKRHIIVGILRHKRFTYPQEK